MTAIQRPTPLQSPLKTRRRKSSRQALPNRVHPHVVMATETSFKLAASVIISIVAVSALGQLLPYNRNGSEKLQEIELEVRQTETRVNSLRGDFTRSFDPQQAEAIMQENSHRTDPDQLQIIWIDNQSKNPPAAMESVD